VRPLAWLGLIAAMLAQRTSLLGSEGLTYTRWLGLHQHLLVARRPTRPPRRIGREGTAGRHRGGWALRKFEFDIAAGDLMPLSFRRSLFKIGASPQRSDATAT
jgi:hypothetical protein